MSVYVYSHTISSTLHICEQAQWVWLKLKSLVSSVTYGMLWDRGHKPAQNIQATLDLSKEKSAQRQNFGYAEEGLNSYRLNSPAI